MSTKEKEEKYASKHLILPNIRFKSGGGTLFSLDPGLKGGSNVQSSLKRPSDKRCTAFHQLAPFRTVSHSFAPFRTVPHSFAQFPTVSHRFVPFRTIRPRFALFGPIWPCLVPFGSVWPCLDLFEPLGPVITC